MFCKLHADVEPNQDFLKFISAEGPNNSLVNLELLLELENKYPGIFVQTMELFESAELYRKGTDKDGNPNIVPWRKALENFYIRRSYDGVTKENRDIAETFSALRRPQREFDITCKVRSMAIADGMPAHILSKPLREERSDLNSGEKAEKKNKRKKGTSADILHEESNNKTGKTGRTEDKDKTERTEKKDGQDRTKRTDKEDKTDKIDIIISKYETEFEKIEQIKGKTGEELAQARTDLISLYDKHFTYEWLSKYDPNNAILGVLCNCCAIIDSDYYGKRITMASMSKPDVQNLVIRNTKGRIIAKGAAYVNREKGYMLINSFELDRECKKCQKIEGWYDVDENSDDERRREMVFQAFRRGIYDFITEYNTENPECPITQVNIGMFYNRLKRQVSRYKKAEKKLEVPEEYGFEDCRLHQQNVFYIADNREEGDYR